MTNIAANDERLVKEYILGLLWQDLMPLPVLVDVVFVPIKSDTVLKRVSVLRHIYSIRLTYTDQDGCGSPRMQRTVSRAMRSSSSVGIE